MPPPWTRLCRAGPDRLSQTRDQPSSVTTSLAPVALGPLLSLLSLAQKSRGWGWGSAATKERALATGSLPVCRGMHTARPRNPCLTLQRRHSHTVPPPPVLPSALPKALLSRADHSACSPRRIQATLSPNSEAGAPKGFHRHSGHPDCHLLQCLRVGTMSQAFLHQSTMQEEKRRLGAAAGSQARGCQEPCVAEVHLRVQREGQPQP